MYHAVILWSRLRDAMPEDQVISLEREKPERSQDRLGIAAVA